MDMLKTAHKYAQSKKGKWRSFCDEHGINYSWLTKFVTGKIPDPGYHKVKKLHDLAKKEAKRSRKR